MTSPILYILTIITFFLCGCATQNEYQKNMADMTSRNVRYLRSLGYKVNQVDKRSGYIQAYLPGTGTSPNDLKMFYPKQQINPYTAVNTASGNQEISSITAYWLPGKEQLARRDRELSQAYTSHHSTRSALSPIYPTSVYSTPVIQSPDNSTQQNDILPKAEHKSL